MKTIFNITLILKRFGVISRAIGIALCCALVFYEAVPDLLFDIKTKNAKVFTEQEIVAANKESLPLYLKISDVQAGGSMYIEQRTVKKDSSSTLSSIIYPVYNKSLFSSGSDLKSIPCNIAVEDSKVKQGELGVYFLKDPIIEGKFDQRLIDGKAKSILLDAGYNISDNCILISKGDSPWSISTCLLVILAAGTLAITLSLSLLPEGSLHRIFGQEQRFERIQ